MRTSKARLLASALLLSFACLGVATPSLAFNSGDVPAPVDDIDMDGPGRSHLNDSDVSGFDGNQGNDKLVGNAGGRPSTPPEDDEDGGEDNGEGDAPILQ